MIGRMLGNRYEILEKIGEGGMAVVYTAKCILLNRIVAIKVLKPEFADDEEFLTKFKNEAQSAAKVTHPNIINVYDVGQDDDCSYIVMEYVDGENLKDRIRKRGRLGETESLAIAEQIAQALQHAHSKGIVHRDIKSHNIMLTSDNIVKVGDFGIAKAVSSATVTAVGSIMGSVHYFSPEQARGGYVDERSDLYSLGIVLYEMLTGRLPFEGDSPVNIALKQIQEEIKFDDKDIVRDSVKELVYSLTQKSPDKRMKSATDVIEAIENIKEGKSIKYVQPKEEENEKTMVLSKEEISKKVVEPKKRYEYEDDDDDDDDYEYEEKSNKTSFKTVILAAVLAFVLSIVGVAGFFFICGVDGIKSIFSGGEKFEVIDFRGYTLEEAQTEAGKLGLQIIQEGTEVNSQYEEGTICSQDPEKGTKVKQGDTIKVIVSSQNTAEVPVPSLTGKTKDEAIKELQAVKLVELVKEEESDKPKGEVILQAPVAGSIVHEGDTVQIVVSSGPKEPENPVTVPNVIGKTVDEARKELAAFTVSESYREDRTRPEGTILSQTPDANTKVEENSSVSIVINRYDKKPTVSYPFLVMLPTDRENVKVKIVDTDTNTAIYDEVVDTAAVEGILKINVSGEQGTTKTYEVFIDGNHWGYQDVTFQ